jgi:hypothetical protein
VRVGDPSLAAYELNGEEVIVETVEALKVILRERLESQAFVGKPFSQWELAEFCGRYDRIPAIASELRRNEAPSTTHEYVIANCLGKSWINRRLQQNFNNDRLKDLRYVLSQGGGGIEVASIDGVGSDIAQTLASSVDIFNKLVSIETAHSLVAFVLEKDYGLTLPRRLQIEFSKVVQAIADREGKEVSSDRLWQCFSDEYLKADGAIGFVEHETWPDSRAGHGRLVRSTVCVGGADRTIEGHGTGPIDAFVDALSHAFGLDIEVVDYSEHAIGKGADAAAVAYVEVRIPGGASLFGVGIDKNIVAASLQAVVSAVNRGQRRGSIELGN